MKLRRVISLLLLVVYLSAIGGASFASLTCRCILLKQTVHRCEHGHCACHHLAAAQPAAPDDGALSAPCCSDRHSTDIELYTSGSQDDNERQVRCLVIELPAELAAECPCPAHCPALRGAPGLRPTPHLADPHLACRGLRAPPVLS